MAKKKQTTKNTEKVTEKVKEDAPKISRVIPKKPMPEDIAKRLANAQKRSFELRQLNKDALIQVIAKLEKW